MEPVEAKAFDESEVQEVMTRYPGLRQSGAGALEGVIEIHHQHGAVVREDNCTAKHKATSQWFKPTVRIYKNMRNYLVESNTLHDGVAPSYFIEGMLWNIPADKFGKSYDDTFVATFNYLVNADRSTFKCANGIHPLLQANSHVSWSPANCQTYLDALRDLWNNWG